MGSRSMIILKVAFQNRFLMTNDSRHSLQNRDNQTQKTRSLFLIARRVPLRFRTADCCRKARFSSARSRRSFKVELRNANSKSSKSVMARESLAVQHKNQQNHHIRGFGEPQAKPGPGKS